MSTSFDLFTSAFMHKARAYNIVSEDTQIATEMLNEYLKVSLSRFNKYCEYDLSDINDELREINTDINKKDLEEIIDIVSEGMVVSWLQPFVNNSDNLFNVLNTTDYSQYAPHNVAKANKELYESARTHFKKLRKNYTYDHGDLTNLHI